MFIIRSIVFLTVIACCASLLSQERPKSPQRDPNLIEVLTRVVNVAGGVQALAAVHDLTESGEITFYWSKDVKGPVSIRGLGGNHFRMEADLPQGKRVWVVKDGVGSQKEADQKPVALSYANAINLGNLTFPVAHLAAALSDPAADVSLVGIEKRDGRSIYRLRLKGRIGLVGKATPAGPFVKEILVDALTFDILAVGDFPYHHNAKGKASDVAPREVAYADFRVVNKVRVPFSIDTKLEGERTFSIRLNEAVFNANPNDSDFAK